MILDFSSEHRVRYDAQIVIVGSGAAGLSLAVSLAETGLKIIEVVIWQQTGMPTTYPAASARIRVLPG